MKDNFSLKRYKQTVTRQWRTSQTYIYTYIYKSKNPVRTPCDNKLLYGTATSQGEGL